MAEALRFIPFGDSWQMRIDHPYSLFVRDGDLVWSCGQCPLAGDGAVLHPGDLAGQAEAVIGFIHRHLGEIGADAGALCQLVVYYVATGEHDAALLADRFRAAFGHGVLVTPVAIPHFYYDGMLIEVDVFASARPKQRHAAAEGDARLEAVSAGGLTWVSVTSQEPVPLSPRPAEVLSRFTDWFRAQIAADGGLPNARKKDSQGICFIGEVKMADFLRAYVPDAPGPIVRAGDGATLGEHRGLHFYTLGQRRGIRIPSNSDHQAYVVVGKRASDRALLVAFDSPEAPGLFQREVRVHALSWIGGPISTPRPLEGRVRYRDPRVPMEFFPEGGGAARIVFRDPQRGLASGQVLAFYEGERLLGGGVYL